MSTLTIDGQRSTDMYGNKIDKKLTTTSGLQMYNEENHLMKLAAVMRREPNLQQYLRRLIREDFERLGLLEVYKIDEEDKKALEIIKNHTEGKKGMKKLWAELKRAGYLKPGEKVGKRVIRNYEHT